MNSFRKRLVTMAIVVLPGLMQAQNTGFGESITVNVVDVDVVVTDSRGRHVHGLRAEDFELRIDGRVQEIDFFHETGASPGVATAAARSATESATSRQDALRRVVVFVDDYSLDSGRRKDVLTSLNTFLDGFVSDGDEVMLVSWNRRMKFHSQFTSDRRVLQDSMAELGKGVTAGLSYDKRLAQIRIANELEKAQLQLQSWPDAYAAAISQSVNFAEEQHRLLTSLIEAVQNATAFWRGRMGGRLSCSSGRTCQRILVEECSTSPKSTSRRIRFSSGNSDRPLHGSR